MSQHLFAADRLAEAGSERLISSGYPLGPHSLAVSISALGPSLVHAFDAITLATAVIASLASLALLGGLSAPRRIGGALLVGFAYMTAAYLTQGAFKETLQALFLLAFAIGLGEAWRGRLAGVGTCAAGPARACSRWGRSTSTASPGCSGWPAPRRLWALVELSSPAAGAGGRARGGWPSGRCGPALYALGLFVVAVAPEVTRIVDFASFETFDPAGAGLGNLFNPLSPLEALGVWPSGDFRLDPGDGAAPAAVYYLGGALGLVALRLRAVVVASPRRARGARAPWPSRPAWSSTRTSPARRTRRPRRSPWSPRWRCWSASARLAEAAPSARRGPRILRRRGIAALFPRSARAARLRLALAALAALRSPAPPACAAWPRSPTARSGPSDYSPALTELRPLDGATLVLAPEEVLADEHGRDYLVWELRGGEVCVEAEGSQAAGPPPPGIDQVIVYGDSPSAPFEGTDAGRRIGPYTLWGIPDPTPGESGCPFVSDGERADPGAA